MKNSPVRGSGNMHLIDRRNCPRRQNYMMMPIDHFAVLKTTIYILGKMRKSHFPKFLRESRQCAKKRWNPFSDSPEMFNFLGVHSPLSNLAWASNIVTILIPENAVGTGETKSHIFMHDSSRTSARLKFTVSTCENREVISAETVVTYRAMPKRRLRSQGKPTPWYTSPSLKGSLISSTKYRITYLDEQFIYHPFRPQSTGSSPHYQFHSTSYNRRDIGLSDQYYGFIFQKNHSLDTFRNTGSILRN